MSINKTFEEELEVAHGKILREKGKERPVVIIIKKNNFTASHLSFLVYLQVWTRDDFWWKTLSVR